jgi:hypothetical protein
MDPGDTRRDDRKALGFTMTREWARLRGSRESEVVPGFWRAAMLPAIPPHARGRLPRRHPRGEGGWQGCCGRMRSAASGSGIAAGVQLPGAQSELKRRCFMPQILRGAVRDRLLFPAGLLAASYRPAAPRTAYALEPIGCGDEGAAKRRHP